MKIKWEAEDGYVGGSRPHYLEVDDDELSECETEEEKNQLIDDYVREDFEQTVTFSWSKA